MKVLVVHQDNELIEDLKYSFEKDGDEIYQCSSLAQAQRYIEKIQFDFHLIDFYLSDGTALDFQRKLKMDRDSSTIVLSKESDIKNIVLCLEYGCDDYMRYPISLLELKARMRRISKIDERENEPVPLNKYSIQSGPFEINLIKQSVSVDNVTIDLTMKEFQLMLYFVENEGKVLSREQIAVDVWVDNEPENIRTVDVYIRRLREKLSVKHVEHKIRTKWGAGYIYRHDFIS